MEKKTILVAEDEPSSNRLICITLKESGFGVLSVTTGKEACSMASSHLPDLVMLNLGLPDMDGTEVISDIRRWSSVPIIVVSARSREAQKVAALDAGADDYLTKPPGGTSELLARIRTALRHSRNSIDNAALANNDRLTIGGLVIDHYKHRVYIDGVDAALTQNEFKIVALLGKYAGKVMTYDYIIKQIWGCAPKNDNQILRVNMANIRRKIEKNPASPEYIFTEIGVGYRMLENE